MNERRESVKDESCVVILTDAGGDLHAYGPFKSRESAYRWLRPRFGVTNQGTGTPRNNREIKTFGETVWEILSLKGPRRGL